MKRGLTDPNYCAAKLQVMLVKYTGSVLSVWVQLPSHLHSITVLLLVQTYSDGDRGVLTTCPVSLFHLLITSPLHYALYYSYLMAKS